MKLKNLLTLAATLAFGFTPAFAAEDDTPLMKEMKAMNKNLRTFKRQAADAAKKDENIGLIDSMKKNVDASLKLQPAQTKDIPAAEKTAYLDKFKVQMTDLGKALDELSAAVKAGKQDDVTKVLEKLSQSKEKGHKDFGADE